MANITFFNTTDTLGSPGTAIAADPNSGLSVAQILQQTLTSYLTTNSAQAQEFATGFFTDGFATDGSFVVQTSTFTLSVVGNISAFGSNASELIYRNNDDGSTLAVFGHFTWAGLPELTSLTSASINTILKTSPSSSTKSIEDGFIVDLQQTSSSTFAGTVTTGKEIIFDPVTGNGVGLQVDGSIPVALNIATDSVSVGSGPITDVTALAATETGPGQFQTTDSITSAGAPGLNISTPLAQLPFRSGSDTYNLTGTSGEPVQGGSGNDVFNVDSPGNVVAGGGGFDTANFANPSTDYIIQATPTAITVTDIVSSSDTQNTLSGISQISFPDGSVQTSWISAAIALAQSDPLGFSILTEMYLAYFNRAPDSVGLIFWAANSFAGSSDAAIAEAFATSQESLQTFGSVGPNATTQQIAAFVTGVYENVLDRQPDSGGLAFWVNTLRQGATDSAGFILQIVDAVNLESNTSMDKIYLSNKEAVGAHFAITDGLTSSVEAHAVMAAYNNVFVSSGPAAAVAVANGMSDNFLANVGGNPELVLQLVGVSV